MAALLHRLHRTLHQIEDGLIVAVLLFMVLLAVAQIVLRNFFGTSLVWIEPLLQNAVLWIGLLGAMIASRNDEHIRIDVASSLLPEKYHPFLTTFVDLFTAPSSAKCSTSVPPLTSASPNGPTAIPAAR